MLEPVGEGGVEGAGVGVGLEVDFDEVSSGGRGVVSD